MSPSTTVPNPPSGIPDLRDGDRLDIPEFLRRYEASETVERAELIKGVVYIHAYKKSLNGHAPMASPVSFHKHGSPQGSLLYWLGLYEAFTTGVIMAAPTTLVLPHCKTSPEADGILLIKPEYGGSTTIGEDGFIHGSPELLIEVSNTSAAFDLGPKREAYEAAGVREYLVWRTAYNIIDWFQNIGGQYIPLEPNSEGILCSRAFPGLWLDVPALFSDSKKQVLLTLQRGLATDEHAAFERQLAENHARNS